MIGFYKFFGNNCISQEAEEEDDHSFEYVGIFNFVDKGKGGMTIPNVNCGKIYKEGETIDEFGYPIDPS